MNDRVATAPSQLDLENAGMPGRRVQRLIASGGSSDVWLVVDAASPAPSAEPPFALKVAVAASADAFRRCQHEVRHLQAIRHPGVVRVRGSGRFADGRAFVLMDFVAGVSLDEHCAGASTANVLTVMTRVAAALHCVHELGIAHGDLKPTNVLVDAAGQPVLVDFGSARTVAPGQLTTTGPAPLTPYYASPETLGGAPATPRSDVYAFGVVLRDLLRDATDRDDLPATRLRHIARCIARCLAVDPTQRYAHAGELRHDLDHLHRRGRLPLAFAVRSWWRRHRGHVAAAAAASLLLGTLAAITVERGEHVATARREALSVSEFLVRLLDQAAPAAAGPDVTLTAAWQRAEPLIPATFRGQPHAEARVRMAYGRAYAGIHDWPRAADHLERAIELLARDADGHPDSVAWCRGVLARCRAGR